MKFVSAKITGVNVDPVAYHAPSPLKRGDPARPVSYSTLKAFLKCPARWRDGFEYPATKAKDFGNIVDTILLTPSAFASRYAVEPETYAGEDGKPKKWNNNAKVCQAWHEAQEGKEIIKPGMLADAQSAVSRLMADPAINEIVSASDAQVAIEGVWYDSQLEIEVPARCMIDLAPRDSTAQASFLADIKTTDSAAPAAFARKAFNFGYHVQAAFYQDLWNAATGQSRDSHALILVESCAPFQTAKRVMAPGLIELGRQTYLRWLKDYCWCLKRGVWPDYEAQGANVNGWGVMSVEPWMDRNDFFAEASTPVGEELPF